MVAAVHHPPIQRTKSLDASSKSKMAAGFGALIRRASQRGQMGENSQQSLDGSNNSSGGGGGLRGILRKAKSLRGMDSSSNSHGSKAVEDMSSSKNHNNNSSNRYVDDDGPSGVASFLSQIEPQPTQQQQQQAQEQAPASEVEKPKQQGGLRGLIRRAASYRGERRTKEPQPQEPEEEEDLEPVLVLTDGNHGKVVFQNLDPDIAMSMSMNSAKLGGATVVTATTFLEHNNASLPDLCGLSVSTSSRSTVSSSDSPVSASKSVQTARTSLSTTSRTSLGSDYSSDFFVDLDQQHQQQQQQREQQQQQQQQSQQQPTQEPVPVPAAEEKQQEQESSYSESSKGFRGRLRTFFKRTKSGRTITEEGPGEGAHVYVPSREQTTPLHEITLPVMDENDDETEHSEQPEGQQQQLEGADADPLTEEDENEHFDSHHQYHGSGVMEGLLEVVQEYEKHEEEDSLYSTEDDDEYYDGDNDDDDDMYYGDDSAEDLGIYDEEPDEADGQEALESFMASYCPSEPAYEDIHVAAQPARVYDELEIFYEEMTFEHVGGSMLLGAASELLTVHECDGEDYSESEEPYDESDNEGGPALYNHGNLLPVLEEDMDESHSSAGSEFI